MKYQESAGIILYRVINNTIEYLLLHYKSGHWDLPKGKIEKDETKEQAALRELHEETNLHTIIIPGFEKQLDYIFTDYDGLLTHKTVYFFIGKAAQKQDIILSAEHQNFLWLTFEQALEKLTYKNAQNILQKAHKYISTLEK